MTEADSSLTTNPPRFRLGADTHPEGVLIGRCDTCMSFSSIGFCIRYQTPVEENNVCDSYASITQGGKRQWAER